MLFSIPAAAFKTTFIDLINCVVGYLRQENTRNCI